MVFDVTKHIQNGAECPIVTIPHFVCNIYKTVCLQNRITAGMLMLAMCLASCLQAGYRMNFDWLSYSCDISACDLNPERNPEKHGRPMKLAIHRRKHEQ